METRKKLNPLLKLVLEMGPLILFFIASLVAALLGRFVRLLWQRRRGTIRIGYPSGQLVHVVPGTSVLEASRLAGVPHA